MAFKPRSRAEHILLEYYEGLSAMRCCSAEGRAEPMSAAAGAPGWIPPFQKHALRRGPENWLARRCDIAKALAELDEGQRELLKRRIGDGLTWETIAEVFERPVRTVRGWYNAAMALVDVSFGERGLTKG